MIGSNAMVLSAGLGLRMRPMTATRPKPLIEVGGKALIDYGYEKLCKAGVTKAVVNVHYLADQMEAWASLKSSPAIEISNERNEILDTGGGVAFALSRLGDAPFFVINSDSIWIDGKTPALQRLRHSWKDQTMDCLLLVCPLNQTVGYNGNGDFLLAADGKLSRCTDRNREPLVYIGAYLIHPRLFSKAPRGNFSMNLLWNDAIVRGRLYGIVHDGMWLHVGTSDAVILAEAALSGRV